MIGVAQRTPQRASFLLTSTVFAIVRVGNNQSIAGDSAADRLHVRRLFAAAMITGTNTMMLIPGFCGVR